MILDFMIAEMVSSSIGYFVEKGWNKILSKDEYEEEMNHVVYSTIEEYKQKRPIITDQLHFPFYDSQIIINELFKIGIGERSDSSETIIIQELNTNPNIKQPQPSDIKLFLDIFYSKCNSNAKIQQLHIEKHYKQEIFNISQKLDMMKSDVNKMLNLASEGLKSEWKRELDMYKQQMESYKPQTALELLEGIEKAMNESVVEVPNTTQAKLHYLKALCYNILLSKKAVGEYKKCHELDPTDILYKEKVAWICYCRNQLEKAKELAQDIKDYDEDHPMANFILCYDESPEILMENIKRLPNYLQESDKMQKCLFNVVFNHFNDITFRPIGKYLIDKYRPQQVIHDGFSHLVDNLNRVDYLLFVYMNSIERLEYNKKVESTPVVEELYSLTKYICHTIDNTEIDSNFKIVKFWYCLSSYIVTNDKEALLNAENFLLKEEYNGLLILAHCLQYEGYNDNALKILDMVAVKTEEHHYMKCYVYSKKGDMEHEIDSINDYIGSLTTIDSLNFVRVVNVITSWFLLEGGKRIHVTSLLEKQYDNPIYLKIVMDFLTCGDKKDEDSFTQLSKDVAEEHISVKSMTALISLRCGFYSIAVKLYQGIVVDGVYDINMFYYIQALHYTKTNNEELLRLLADWRKNSSQKNMSLLEMEYNLRVTLRDWETALEIAASMYRENSFDEYTFTNYLICLWKNGKKDEIAKVKDMASAIPYVTDQYIHNTALVFAQVGLVNDAVSFLYTYAKSVNKTQLRMDYMNISSMMKVDTIFKTYEKVEDGMYVVYNTEKDERDKLIYIEPESKSQFVVALRGKRVGETVLLSKTLVNAVVKIYIKNILNKYYALWKEIYDEMDTPETEMPVHVMNIPESNIEIFNDFVVKNFAPREMERKKAIEEFLNKYEQGEAPLGVAGMLLYEGDFIRAYYTLCTEKYGILLNPYAMEDELPTDDSTEYVLDFSSMMLFYELHRNHGVTFKHKFVISKVVRDIIEDKKAEKQQEADETMSLDISFEGVRPILHTKEEKDYILSMYNNMLSWIDENCKVEFSVSRLDELRTHGIDSSVDKHIGFDYTADYMHLVCKNNRVAISDDQLVCKMVMSKNQCISTYSYLRATSCVNDIERKLLEMNYIGVPIQFAFVYEEFKKKQRGEKDLYMKSLKSWHYLLPYHMQFVLHQLGKLVKEIYLTSLVVDNIHSEAQRLFVTVLQEIYEVKVYIALSRILDSEFKLLGRKREEVLADLIESIKIIGADKDALML